MTQWLVWFYCKASVKEKLSLPSSPETWASCEEVNSKRTMITTLILNFDEQQSQKST